MKWLTPFILFTIVFAVGFVFLHNAGFDTWSAAGKALATLGVLLASLLCLLASAFLISVDDAARDEQRQDLIHSALHACNKSAEQQTRNLGAWALVLDRMRGQKPVLRWKWVWNVYPDLMQRPPLGSYAIGINSDGSAFAQSIDSEYVEALHAAHMAQAGKTHSFRNGTNPDAPSGPKPAPPANPPGRD